LFHETNQKEDYDDVGNIPKVVFKITKIEATVGHEKSGVHQITINKVKKERIKDNNNYSGIITIINILK